MSAIATDFFQSAPAEKAAVQTSAMPATQYIRNVCDCGAGGGWRMVSHYDVFRCRCGWDFWAIRPKRNGPLVASPWPGLPGMQR